MVKLNFAVSGWMGLTVLVILNVLTVSTCFNLFKPFFLYLIY